MKITVTSLEAHAENQVWKGPGCHQNANNENPSCPSCLPFIFPFFLLSKKNQQKKPPCQPEMRTTWSLCTVTHEGPERLSFLPRNVRHAAAGATQSILMKPQHLPQPPLLPPSPPSPPPPLLPRSSWASGTWPGGNTLHYESPTMETGAHFTFKCLNWLILSDNIFLKAFLPS